MRGEVEDCEKGEDTGDVALDDLHVEQGPVEGDRGVEVVDHETDVMDAADHATRRSRICTRLPLGSRT